MAAPPYILARTFTEAHVFAQKDLGLDPGHYRVVNSAGTLKAVRGVDLYLVPGWKQRFDRFAMASALRWSRMNVIDVAEQAEAPVEPAPISSEDATAFLLQIELEIEELVASGVDWEASGDPADDLENAKTLVENADPAKTRDQTPVQRRRRKCNECGQMHYKNDPCPQVS